MRVTTAALLAIVLGVAVEHLSPLGSLVLAAIGLVLLATGVTRMCPAYTLFGINTCPRVQAGARRQQH